MSNIYYLPPILLFQFIIINDFKFTFPPKLINCFVIPNRQQMLKKPNRKLTFDEKVAKCEQFLKNFQDYDMLDVGMPYQQYGRRKYMIKLQQLANDQLKTLEIYVEDLEGYFRKDQEKQLVDGFRNNTDRYVAIFQDIVDRLIPQRNIEYNPDNELKLRFQNILKEQRRDNLNTETSKAENQRIPKQAHRDYDIAIVFGPNAKFSYDTISDLTAEKIGSIVACKAIVVRCTEVKPQLVIATYACDVCGCENYYSVENQSFGPMTKCQSKLCVENKINGKLTFLPGHSKFISYQQLKIQETPDQLKQGKIPKNFPVHLKGNLVKQATPGDIIVVHGTLVTHRRTGRFENDLAFNTHLVATKIIREKKKYVEMNITEENRREIQNVRSNYTEDQIFQKLARSIAPEIYGLEEVKKSLLLLMTGGVTKVTHDNLRIRGEINVALFGDPGIAKSQLLKHISFLAPRGIYTTGKGSSGVGLTAAVVKDPFTQQLALEAGALVLADMGVCCIDEFDKMDEYDRTAIHEVMEQQTISIAKAGITTTLNARSSILAAANPLYGRYNKTISPHKNINLPAALLSRFDLIFILLDSAEEAKDLQLAKHIGMVHKLSRAPMEQKQIFSPQFIRAYIALAKQHSPVLTEQLHDQIIHRYIKKRQEQMDMTREGENYTTMRSLLGLIRLAQARARLRFSDQISKADIHESLQIIEESQRSVTNTKFDKKNTPSDDISSIFAIIKDLCTYREDKTVDYDTCLKRILARGHTEQKLKLTLHHYEILDVVIYDKDDNKITLVDQ